MKLTGKSFASFLTALAILLSCSFGLLEGSASAVTQDEIDELKAQRDEIAAQKEEQQEVVDMLTQEQADVIDQKAALDQQSEYTMEQIRLNEQEIALYNEIIAEKEQDVAKAQAAEDAQLELYRSRVRAMEEGGGYNILAFLLQADNISELLTAIDDIGEIMSRDREIEDAYTAAREHKEAVKAEYESVRADLQAREDELEAEQEQLQKELDEVAALILQYTEYIELNQEKLDEFQAMEDEADEEINALIYELEQQRKAEAQAAAKNGGGVTASVSGAKGSGSFCWPVSCTYITSCVGNRFHPVTGVWKYHSGMDIGASYGDTVWASDGGTVSLAGENGGYGNCVMIDHGNGYYTLYGHLSSIAVSKGQTVGKGDTIGYVGSTGVSTGPHLHFEIREGSNCLDFASWFSGLTYAPDSGGA